MKKDIILTSTFVIAFLLLSLHLIGAILPGSMNWGVHFLGFLPLPVTLGFIVIFILITALARTFDTTKHLRTIARLSETNQNQFLITIIGLFIGAAFIFRVKASLLGDSFTIITNYMEFEKGLSPLAPWHEPFSMFFFYYGVRAFSRLVYPELFWSFFSVELFLGIAFILIVFFISKLLIKDPVTRLLTFLLVLVMPYMEFFFGYIEVYAFSIVIVALFILLSVLVMQERIPFYILAWWYVILTFSHYINGALGLSLLYLAYLQFKKKHTTGLLLGFGGAGLLVLIILSLVQFDMTRLIDVSPISHQLSLTEDVTLINEYSQAYTIFSPYHFLDIANYLIMMAPFTLTFILYLIIKHKRSIFTESPVVIWFLSALIPVGLYFFFAKLEQGFADDWDVFASLFVPVTFFAAFLFSQYQSSMSIRAFTTVLLFSALFSLPWFTLNATQEPSIKRFVTLWDKRNVSHLGQYTMALRLTRYYDAINDTVQPQQVWNHYRSLFPGDPRGYENEINALNTYTPEQFQTKVRIYESWLHLDPTNTSIRRSYATECYNAGTYFYSNNLPDSALLFYNKSIAADSTFPPAYNNMGSIVAQQGNLSTAVRYFSKAIALDSSYADAYYNLGSAYQDLGRKDEGNVYIQKFEQLKQQDSLKPVQQ